MNEGLVEWPPSPWRLCRALLATGYSKLSWRGSGPPDEARELIERLAASPPLYRLPPATVSHTRHYMPIERGKTTKVFDTFAQVGEGQLVVSWDIELPDVLMGLLEKLVTHMSYLGRAESWVRGDLVTPGVPSDLPLCEPSEPAGESDPGWESVRLLAPVAVQDYATWRERALGEAREREEAAAGKKLTRSRLARLEAAHPSDLLACLQVRTGDLHAQGWSQPPGSQWVPYRRPVDALRTPAPTVVHRHRTRASVPFALLALSSDTSRGEVLPRMSRCLPQGELLHRGLVSLAVAIDGNGCPEIAGKDVTGTPLRGHRHAHYLPLDLDGDGRLDHVLVYAPMGLGHVAQRALARIRKTWTKGDDRDLFVSLAGLGGRDDMRTGLAAERADPDLLGIGCVWESHTPFVAPRFIKPRRHTLEDQLLRELVERGLPEPRSIEVLPREDLVRRGFLHYVRARRDRDRRPPTAQPWLVRLRFAEPIAGPIALGYACHYGLGVFRPVRPRSDES